MRTLGVGLTILALAAVPAFAAYDVIVTPDQFNFQTWGGNLSFDTAGAYPGDTAAGYGYTNNFANSPSATVIIPLPPGMPSGWNVYEVYQWNPTAHSTQWHVVDIAGDGTMNNNPTEPWAGQAGTNHQYLANGQNNDGAWVLLGSGPQSDPTLYGGHGVWMNPSTGNGAPYLQIHYLGFENAPESFDAIRVVQVPEPASLACLGLGGLVLVFKRRQRPVA